MQGRMKNMPESEETNYFQKKWRNKWFSKKVKKLIILNKMKMKKHILTLKDSNTFTPLVSSILFVVQTHCLFLFQCNGGRPILNWFSQHRWSFPRNLIYLNAILIEKKSIKAAFNVLMCLTKQISLPGPFEPPWRSRPRRNMTARSYSWTTSK